MDDRALATLLLRDKPNRVNLIGEPVFRLNSMLCDASGAKTAPQISSSKNLDQFIDTNSAIDQATSDGVMCLYLPADIAHPDKVLGLACRASPRLLVVEHTTAKSHSELFDDDRFYAFGFRRIGTPTDVSGLQRAWYAYSLRDYKQSPDWLNARFWANPERYDVQD